MDRTAQDPDPSGGATGCREVSYKLVYLCRPMAVFRSSHSLFYAGTVVVLYSCFRGVKIRNTDDLLEANLD
jgi:hypothetical protein